MKFNLNRSFKKFYITEETPIDVIIFLMKSTGKIIDKDKIPKKFVKIKTYLENYEDYIEIKDTYSAEELSKISNFVSDLEYPWTMKNLLSSFTSLTESSCNESAFFFSLYFVLNCAIREKQAGYVKTL